MNQSDAVLSAECRSAVESIRQRILRISSHQKPRILIVEDDTHDTEMLRQQLEQQCVPCEIETVENCEDALYALRSKPFDLAFIDLRFPLGMSGTDLLRAVKSDADKPTFIAISGLKEEETPMREAMLAGAAAIFTKPFTDRQLQGICGMVTAT